MLSDYSITISRIINNFKAGDPNAMDQLWEAYFDKLFEVARNRLKEIPKRVKGEETLLVSVFVNIWDHTKQERIHQLQDRNDLWHLLLKITDNKIDDVIRQANRVKQTPGKSVEEQWIQIASKEPSGETVGAMENELNRLLGNLGNESLREVALLKLELFSNKEIALRLKISERTVVRKIALIVSKWRIECEKGDSR